MALRTRDLVAPELPEKLEALTSGRAVVERGTHTLTSGANTGYPQAVLQPGGSRNHTSTAMPKGSIRRALDSDGQTLLLVRWLLILATAYLILYRNSVRAVSPMVALFVAGYLSSKLIVAFLVRRFRSKTMLNTGIALVDTIVVSVALVLTQTHPADLLVLYFVVVLIATLPENLAVVTAAAGLIATSRRRNRRGSRGNGTSPVSTKTALSVPIPNLRHSVGGVR